MIKMKNILLLLSTAVLFSCGKLSPQGEVELQKVSIQDFSDIQAKGKFRLTWVPSSQNLMEIETYPNFINNLDISQQNNILHIKEKRPTQGLGFYNITLFSKSIPKNIQLSDSIEFSVSGKIDADYFQLKLKDNAKFIGSLHTKKTVLEMENLSLANFNGYTEELYFKIKDTAGVIAPYFEVDVLDIDAKNNSYLEIKVKDTIKGNIQNTAKLTYIGTPFFRAKKEKTTTIVSANN